ncbi:urease accessory protein UreE [Niabella drilacis]|uniref:Urease accessory protein UreE n=1 Tax=Niabella drilacis (strain DSM 25811 / CCM 8410 / CCUG 62505 / LMG 26954 / E90) TaxID=1285928 RepID=A0A1G6UZ88_NIADE|nr:urease accessory protein UreE [Niabella drilacis]SDD45946.1 urease accessory protein [Niabella drilacis]
MIINEIMGNISDMAANGLTQDLLELEWYETTKRIQRKRTLAGREIAIKFLREGQRLRQGDVLLRDGDTLVTVNIKPCEAIVIAPQTLLEMGTVCYEIGNKHMPLFIQDNKVMMPFEMPMFRWLEGSGYKPQKQVVRLLNILKSNVEPHNHGNNNSLFSKILNLASKE